MTSFVQKLYQELDLILRKWNYFITALVDFMQQNVVMCEINDGKSRLHLYQCATCKVLIANNRDQ